MLTDTKLRNLKPQDKMYKVADRDGLYVAVSPAGTVSFRYDYRINGRRETLTLGRYGRGADGITLAEARDELSTAKKLVNSGVSPSAEKRRGKTAIRNTDTLGEYTDKWLAEVKLAESTRNLKRSVINRVIKPWRWNYRLAEISTADVRELCEKVKADGARATALQARDIINSVYSYAIERGADVKNPAEDIRASSIATFDARDRALTPKEIGCFLQELDHTGTMPTLRLAVKLVLLTMVRKSELLLATWSEIDFDKATWSIPAERMKASRSHVIYLSRQALDLLIGLKTCAGGSDYLLPSRFSIHKPLSNATLNRVITQTVKGMQEKGFDIKHFTVHDMRRTASTLLHEEGFNSDWIEKCLAHEQRGVRAVYNKAEYAAQRRDMLQQWADMVDSWTEEA